MSVNRYAVIIENQIDSVLLWDPEAEPDFAEVTGMKLILESDAIDQGLAQRVPDHIQTSVEQAKAAIESATTVAGLRKAMLQYLEATGDSNA